MKKQILTAVATLIATSSVFAAPFMMGNVRQQDELMVINEKVVCSAYSADAANISPATIVHGTFTSAVSIENGFDITGNIDGEIFSIHGNQDTGSVHLSLQEHADAKSGKLPSYSMSTSGNFTHQAQVVDLTVTLNGRMTSVSCSVQKGK